MSEEKPPAGEPHQRGMQGYTVGKGRRRPASPTGSPKASGGASSRRLALVAAGVVAVAAAAVGGYVAFAGGGTTYKEGLKAGGCTDVRHPDQGRGHLAEGEAPPDYNSDPPTSGAHDPGPALWGIYDTPVPEDKLVHNLEHGGLVVQYGDKVPADQVALYRKGVLDHAKGNVLVFAPDPALGDRVAMTMWTRLITCQRYDDKVFDTLATSTNKDAPETPIDPSQGRQPNFG